MDYLNKPASYYFTETDLKKILLDVLPSREHVLVIPLKRKALVRELNNHKEVVGKFISQSQLDFLNRKKQKNTEPTYLTPVDLAALDGYFSRYQNSRIKQLQHGIIKTFVGAGFRVQELCDFDANALDKENNRIRILGKGKKWRWTQVSESMMMYLLGWKEKHKLSITFQNSYNMDYVPFFLTAKDKPFTPRNVQKFMDNITKKVTLTHKLHPHLLRHTYAVHRIIQNPTLSIEELRQDLGQEDVRTTQIYFRLADKERVTLAKRREKTPEKELKPVTLTPDEALVFKKLMEKMVT